MPKITRAVAVKNCQFKRLIQITEATSRHYQRDVLVLMLGHHAALRITETSRIFDDPITAYSHPSKAFLRSRYYNQYEAAGKLPMFDEFTS